MEYNGRSGLRELQIAQSLVALRWAAIPILLAFAFLAIRLFGMSFSVTPIYVLGCLLAGINIFFTVHISVLSRQLQLRHGPAALKRFLMICTNQLLQELRGRGISGFMGLPSLFWRTGGAMYLMVLEALRGVRLNLLSLENVMHSQMILDILAITMLIRYTGATESPLPMLLFVPVITAGAVLGFYQGTLYAMVGSSAYLLVGLLVNLKAITHVKFYGPQFGDLSQSVGWTFSSYAIMAVALIGSTYLAHHLTSVFKERIFFLNQLLEKNRRESTAQAAVAENVGNAWFILDPQGTILKYKRGYAGFFPTTLTGRCIFDAVPSFKQSGMEYLVQSVLTGGKQRDMERVNVLSPEGTSHVVCCRLMPMVDADGRALVLLIVEDLSELLYFKEHVTQLRQALEHSKLELEKVTLDAREANQQLMKSLKTANERSLEIQELQQTIQQLETVKSAHEGEISQLKDELAALKSHNDQLTADLRYKHLILEEITGLLTHCTNLEDLTNLVEQRTRSLFKLDNASLHVFQAAPSEARLSELLDTRRVSPRLLDLPRRNPKVLEPVLNDGKPVIIRAEVRPDKAASMAITNGQSHRLVAYLPVRLDGEVLGMMMLERFGPEENTDRMMEMLIYYLNHTASALRNALMTRSLEQQREKLDQTIGNLEAQMALLTEMIQFEPAKEELPFQTFLARLCVAHGANDGVLMRFHNDGSSQLLARIEQNRSKELLAIEEQVMKALVANPTHKASMQGPDGTTLNAWPLKQGARLVGILFLHVTVQEQANTSLLDVCAKMVEEHLSLYVLREEKELWENFYQETLQV